MTDQIQIKDLLLRAIIGINAEERRNRQDVLINITLHADTRAAGLSDDIADAVNYRTITKRVIAMVESSQFYLVEKLAAEIAALCLDDPCVEPGRPPTWPRRCSFCSSPISSQVTSFRSPAASICRPI